MRVTKMGGLVAAVCVWSTIAAAIAPATTEQMFCVPAAFVIATVADESPYASVPEDCKEGHRFFCDFEWPLTIKIDQILAARTSDFPPEEPSSFQRGSVLHVRVSLRTARNSEGVTPDDWQGDMRASGSASTSALRRKKFIFGLAGLEDSRSQIWSMSVQGRLEKTLMDAASGQRQDQLDCPHMAK